MASITYRKSGGVHSIQATLLDGVTGTTNGEWVSVAHYQQLLVQVQGVVTATVEIRGSVKPTLPANSDHGFLVVSAFTAEGSVAINPPIEWIKARVTSYTSGTISCYLLGYNQPE